MGIYFSKSAGDALRTAGALSTVGLSFVLALVIGFWFGIVLDRWLGTKPLFTIVCFFLGLAAGILNVYRIVSQAYPTTSGGPRRLSAGAGPPVGPPRPAGDGPRRSRTRSMTTTVTAETSMTRMFTTRSQNLTRRSGASSAMRRSSPWRPRPSRSSSSAAAPEGALGVLAGAALMAVSYAAIKGGVTALLHRAAAAIEAPPADASPAARVAWAPSRFIARYLRHRPLLAWAILVPLRAHPLGLFAGVTAPVLAIAIEACPAGQRPSGRVPPDGFTGGPPYDILDLCMATRQAGDGRFVRPGVESRSYGKTRTRALDRPGGQPDLRAGRERAARACSACRPPTRRSRSPTTS